MRVNAFIRFVVERYCIYLKRKKGSPPPWTDDKILRQYRFCNVYREYDKVTRWLHTNWRLPYRDHKDLWFWMVIARFINRIEALEVLPPPTNGGFNPARFMDILHSYQRKGNKVFSAAYIISTGGKRMDKIEYVAEHVLDPLWKALHNLRPVKGDYLANYAVKLRMYNGLGSFITGQIIADIKYVRPLLHARDWWTFAVSGPGSRRGLNRVYDRTGRWNEFEWYDSLLALWKRVEEPFKEVDMPPMHMQDLQNCLCEFDKYERARLGEGRPKQNYNYDSPSLTQYKLL